MLRCILIPREDQLGMLTISMLYLMSNMPLYDDKMRHIKKAYPDHIVLAHKDPDGKTVSISEPYPTFESFGIRKIIKNDVFAMANSSSVACQIYSTQGKRNRRWAKTIRSESFGFQFMLWAALHNAKIPQSHLYVIKFVDEDGERTFAPKRILKQVICDVAVGIKRAFGLTSYCDICDNKRFEPTLYLTDGTGITYCWYCAQATSQYCRCPGCHVATYCSRPCLKKHTTLHQQTCWQWHRLLNSDGVLFGEFGTLVERFILFYYG